jgi:Cell wall hydrolyses involved in spore germination
MRKQLCAILFFAVLALCFTVDSKVEAAQPATLRLGMSGADVPDLQFRLKTLGYFQTDITNYFGPITRKAVIAFQKDYGLTPDGIAGPRTWAMLKRHSVNKPELDKLARIIYSEARGEPYKGQVAVGAVVMNRLKSPLFPNTLTGVIMEPYAFTAVMDGQYGLTPNATAYKAALDAVRGYDPTGGALFYYNPKTATNSWIRNRQTTAVIGNHVFAI